MHNEFLKSYSRKFLEIGWTDYLDHIFLIIVSIVLILLFIPSTKKKFKKDENEIEVKLSDIWKNKFFISVIPLGFFNYGGMYAIQTLWAGPWMVRVTGYSPLESAIGLFWINFIVNINYIWFNYFTILFVIFNFSWKTYNRYFV